MNTARTRSFPSLLLIPLLCALAVVAVFVAAPAALCPADDDGWCGFMVVAVGGPVAGALAGVAAGYLLLGRVGAVTGCVALVAMVAAALAVDLIRRTVGPVDWGSILAITATGVVMYGAYMVLAFGFAYRLGTAIAHRARDREAVAGEAPEPGSARRDDRGHPTG